MDGLKTVFDEARETAAVVLAVAGVIAAAVVAGSAAAIAAGLVGKLVLFLKTAFGGVG